jgi:hypothetical protein
MRAVRSTAVLGMAFLLCLCATAAPMAVVTANAAETWYTTKAATGAWVGFTATAGFAPFPVFFEGHASTPRADIVDYSWDYDVDNPGNPLYKGFNFAHIYEDAGTYTARLTVTDTLGATDTEDVVITVSERTGTAYYVDSAAGNDANPGTEAEPWQTATRVWAGFTAKTFDGSTGKAVYFKRGQTFDLTPPATSWGHYKTGYGYLVGAYGAGADPIIRRVGPSTAALMRSTGYDNFNHCVFRDLVFESLATDGSRGDIFIMQGGRIAQVAFIGCTFNNAVQSLGINGYTETNKSQGVFVKDCAFYNSSNLHTYTACGRYAMTGCTLDLSGNHLSYNPYVDSGYYYGNTYTRCPWGRTMLRISAESSGGFTNPSQNVVIRNNIMDGWIDPVIDGTNVHDSGTRYNWVGVEISPNTPSDQSIEWVDFSYNTVQDCEALMFISAAENVFVRNNTLTSPSTTIDPMRLNLNARFAKRPLKNIYIEDNAITAYCAGSSGNNPRIIAVNHWAGAAYGAQTIHENLVFEGNTITMQNRIATGIWHSTTDATANAQITSQNVWTGVDRQVDKVVKLGGSYNVAGTEYELDSWYNATGNEAPESGTPEEPPADPPADPGDQITPFLLWLRRTYLKDAGKLIEE